MVAVLALVALTLAFVGMTAVSADSPPRPGADGSELDVNETATLWSKAPNECISTAEYEERYDEQRTAMQELGNCTDITFKEPPDTAERWTAYDYESLEGGGTDTSIYPTDAELTDSVLIADAHATTFAIQPSTIEMYDQSRFFTVTADHVDGTPMSINERQDALEAVHEEFVAEDHTGDDIDDTTGGRRDDSGQVQTLGLEDEVLLEKARSAGNGEKFDRLWRGNISGYDSQSEADMALCCLLAFWTGGNRLQMARLFRQSGLIRGKWDDVHHADGSTYGEKTLERAIAATDDFYEPTTPTVETSVDAADTDTDTVSTFEAGVAEPRSVGGDRVYLEEKNSLLEARIDELEQVVADQRDQIEQLTAERQQLRSIVEQQESDLEDTTESPSEKDEGSSSLRTRMQRLWRRS